MFLVPSDYNTLIEFLVGAVVVSTYFAGKKVPYPKQISLSITNIWKILRNRYSGHKDPDAGTVATVYDALDRPVRRTDANGNTTVYSYDLAGRVLTAVHESGSDTETVTYTYDNAPGRGVGKLASVRHDNSLIYAIDERNKFRKPRKCRFGNDTGTEYSYNAYGMLTGIKNGNLTVSGGTVNSGVTPGQGSLFYIVGGQYRKLTYAYNTRGFIGSKYDERTEQGESYTYDALDRLTSFTVNNVTAATFTYGNNGNITSNTKVGDYAYESGKPHAVTSIEGNLSCPIHPSQCDVEYNVRNMPSAIVENGYRILIDYDASGMRRHTEITAGNTLVKEKTRISSLFETEATPFSSRRLDYIYAEGRIVAVRVYTNGSGSLYYVLTDHLGSWERVLDQSRNTIQQTHFAPWGNRMSFTAWNTPQTQTTFNFDRGFTGHEHYDSLHIINANARLYDPVIGRFFSPDPYVQTPDFTQAFNRYSYCMNNPVMYSDPDGEIFGTVLGFLSDLIDNVFVRTFKGEQWDWTQTKNGWEIDKSIFYSDPNKSTGARIWEIISRFTWQLPQTLIGDLFVSGANSLGFVNNITHGYGVTAVDMGIDGGVTIGYFTGGPNGYTADWRDHLFVHEYGHYVQSQQHGPLYLFSVAIPSGLSALIHNKTHGSIDHRNRWFEADASYKGSAYFDKYYGSGKEGYVAGSPDYFDKYSFSNKTLSPYINPRTNSRYQTPHPISGKFHWTDIPITGVSIEVLLSLLLL